MTDNTLYYFGDDKVFFSNLMSIISQDTNITVTLKKFFASQESSIQSLFTEVAQGLPDAVLIDFSLHSDDYLHLARILARTPFKKKVHIIGILDHLKESNILIEAQSTGVSLCFIKSDHTRDIVQTLLRLIYPKKISSPNYVKVKLNEKWLTGLVSKVGYITEDGMHFETNLKLKVGDVINLQHFWRNKTLIPSKEVMVKKVEEQNLVYNYNYAVDVEFEFMDRIKTPDRTPAEEVKRYNLIEEAKYRFKKIFLKNISSSRPKRAKVLAIDSEFLIYDDKKRSDRFPYMLRCLGSEVNLLQEVIKFTPHIIVFSLDEEITENTVETIAEWGLKQEQVPYLIIFNSARPVKEWQEKLRYQNILASTEELNIDILMKMAQVFDKKIQNLEVQESKRIFISKNKEESNCEIEIGIKVNYLSETDIIFTSRKKIPVGSNLNIQTPIRTLAYVVDEKEQGEMFQYQALLHSHDELEKNSIRRYVNSALFKENEPQVSKSDLSEQDIKLQEILKKSQLKSGE